MSEQEPAHSSPEQPKSFWQLGLEMLGIDIGPAQRFHIALKARFLLIIAGGLAIMLIMFTGAAAYSVRPSFCNSCHIMEPYYKAWSTSAHNKVSCVLCHYPPGKPKALLWYKFQALSQVVKYVTRTYSSKPYADIEDASCLRSGCHSTRLIQGKVVTKKGIIFDHKNHLEQSRKGIQLRCVSCHSQIAIGNHMEVTWDTCYLCHFLGQETGHKMELPGGCQRCHQIPSEPIKLGTVTVIHKDFVKGGTENCQDCHRNILEGGGAVDQDRCYTCHNQPEKLARFPETQFIHDNHVSKHHVACFHCHTQPKHGLTISKDSKSLVSECAKCHSNMHSQELNLYKGVGLNPEVPKTPSPMFQAGVDCTGCHSQEKMNGAQTGNDHTFVTNQFSCANCHGQEYTGMVPAYQKMVDETMSKLSVILTAEQQAMKSAKLDDELAKKINEKLAQVAADLNQLKSTHSAHNIYYAAETLSFDDRVLTAVAKKLELKVEDTSHLPMISGGYCATLCHEKLGVEVPPKIVQVKGKQLDHNLHLKQGLTCRVCHTFGSHKDIKLNEKACESCHGDDYK
jgi:nitrate/TMAO reductase-like tetraheme cytochrome c subunit